MDMINGLFYICRLQGSKSILKMEYLLYVHEIKFKHEYIIWTWQMDSKNVHMYTNIISIYYIYVLCVYTYPGVDNTE